MSGRRLAATGAGVVALLALAGIASHGRPLSGGSGPGPSATFFDYVATTLLVIAVLVLAFFVYMLVTEPRGELRPRRGPWYLLNSLLMFAGAALLAVLILHSGFEQRLRKAAADVAKRQHAGQQFERGAKGTEVRNARIRWDEIVVVVALLGGTAILLVARGRTRRLPRLLRGERASAVSRALDDSIDDLLTDPDLRRAIVAAYARMERALAGAGLPRHPAEAPFEYVARALTSLDASAASAERLTELFEWAKFSHHEPGPEMRDDAVAALVAVRDELRRPEAEPVPA